MNCWICGDLASTGEHKTKKSDMRSVLGSPTQAQPLFYHSRTAKNRRIGSLNNNFLKSASRLCAKCNNQRTQPHDRAWESLSFWLRTRNPPIKSGDVVRADRIFACNASMQMRYVQLYFTKLTGCHFVETNMKFDATSFSKSILTGRINPYVYLKFGLYDDEMVGMSDLKAATLTSDGSCAFATWFYCLGRLAVNVMYAIEGEQRQGLVGAWHPSSGSNRILIADFP